MTQPENDILIRIESKIDKVTDHIYGDLDGTPGLGEQVRDNTKNIEKIEKKVDEISGTPDRIGQWIIRIVLILISLGTLYIAFVK